LVDCPQGWLFSKETSIVQTVVITGVSGYWGQRVAQRLLAMPDVRVLGIDRQPPARPPDGLDFIKADIRNPLLVDLLRAEQVDTLLHLAWRQRQWRREEDFESNVLGTMQLFGACVDAGVRQVVWRSTTAVYGAQAENALYLPETTPLAARASYAYVRDALEVERFVAGFAAEYPQTRFATLRLANVIGVDVDSPLSRLLRQPVWPDLLGFDPLLQVIDIDDALAALAYAASHPLAGPVNVAAPGILSLDQLAGRLGRPTLPILHWLVYWSWPLLSSLPAGRDLLDWLPLEPDYLRYPWVADLTLMQSQPGLVPQWNAGESVRRFVEQQRSQRYQRPAEGQPYADDQLERVITQRRPAAPASARVEVL
jgi:UDP-glucose 4-epimerase